MTHPANQQAMVRFWGPENSLTPSTARLAHIRDILGRINQQYQDRPTYLAQTGADPTVFLPGHLWGGEHCQQNRSILSGLDQEVIENLRFFTGNFTGFSLLEMAAAKPRSGEAVLTELPPDHAQQVRRNSGRIKQVVENFLTCTSRLPARYLARAPRIMGECGWEAGGVIINYDTWSLQQRLNALYCSGCMQHLEEAVAARGRCRILEIGAGYGVLAYTLIKLLDKVDYVIVDLPESLIYSAAYLSEALPAFPQHLVEPGETWPAPGDQVSMICNHLLPEFLPSMGEMDLVVNTLSLTEMAPRQVEFYAQTMPAWLGNRGVFFEQNYHEPGVHTDTTSILKNHLPYHRRLEETLAPHGGRGEANLWATRYQGTVFDVSDQLAWDALGLRPMGAPAQPPH